MAGVQNSPEQKFKDFLLTSLVDMEPATFMKMKDVILDDDVYPKGMTPLTKDKVEPCNKRLLMELITETYELEQSKKFIVKLYKRLKVDAVFEAPK